MNISVTIMEMLQQGMVFHLIGMAGLLTAVALVVVFAVGDGILKRDALAAQPAAAQVEHRAGNSGEVTAAITAAVGKYRNKNK